MLGRLGKASWIDQVDRQLVYALIEKYKKDGA
jgi:hypothetical protein